MRNGNAMGAGLLLIAVTFVFTAALGLLVKVAGGAWELGAAAGIFVGAAAGFAAVHKIYFSPMRAEMMSRDYSHLKPQLDDDDDDWPSRTSAATDTAIDGIVSTDQDQKTKPDILLENAGGLLALAMIPAATSMGAPWEACAIAVAAWAVNRVGHVFTMKLVQGLPKTMAVGAAGLGMTLRVWLIAFVLFMVGAPIGLDKPNVAVPAIIMFAIVLAVDIGVRMIGEIRNTMTRVEEIAE